MLNRLFELACSLFAVFTALSKPVLTKEGQSRNRRRPLVEITIFRCELMPCPTAGGETR